MLADNNDDHLKGSLYLDLKVHHVIFNQKGKYSVKFSISSSRGDLRKVKLYLDGSKQSMFEYEYTSEPCYQNSLDGRCELDDRQFRFEMPEEFSEGEVILLFETYQFTDNPLEEPFKCGEGKFLVFPCASPIQNDQPSTSKDSRDLCYNYTTQITINNLLVEEQLYVNVGHIQITVLLQIEQEQGNKTQFTSYSVVPHQPLNKTIIYEEGGLTEDLSHNVVTEFAHTYTNFENTSLDSDTVYTSELNSLHVNPSSRENISAEETGDVSTNVSSAVDCVSPSTHSFEIRQGTEQVRQDALDDSTPSSIKPVLVDTRRAKEYLQIQERKDAILNESERSTLSKLQAGIYFTGQKKEYPMKEDTLKDKGQFSSKEEDRLNEGITRNTGKDRSNLGKGRTNEAMSRNMSLSSKKTVNDAALPSNVSGPSTRYVCGSYLNEVGIYEVVVVVHSACDLPPNTQGRPPQPYVTGSVTGRTAISQCSTHATLHPTYSPLWEELLVVKIPKENCSGQELILNVIDHPRKTLITEYRLPLEPLKPFYPYHLELEQAGSESKAKLFITLMLKTDELILSSLQSEVFGLEVVLRQLSPLIEGSTDPIVAALRIVSDSNQYRQRFPDARLRDGHIRTRKLKLPSTDLSRTLKSLYDENQYKVPQVTFPGQPVEQPKWDQMFFFYGDDRWLFTSSSALVIEFYNALQVVSFGRWQPGSPVGYSILDLNESLLSVLKQDNASMGVRVDDLSVNESTLRDKSGSLVNVNVILRLVRNKRPDSMLAPAHFHILPSIEPTAKQPVSLQRNIAAINPSIPLPMINQHGGDVPDSSNPRVSSGQLKATTGVDSTAISVMERQAKEMEKQRYAMKKMADDILKLKSEATHLQAANSRLRLQLDHCSQTSQPAVSLPPQLENTTHAELVQRIVIIKGSLDEQTAINRELKLEIRSLQNQLIKKNEKEKDLYKLQEAHKNQQVLLQKMQERVGRTKTLEETCKRQEKVILRLEDVLASTKAKENKKKSEDEQTKTVEETLSEENKRLRALVLNYERASKAIEEMDRLQIHEKLRRSEGRVAALEKELLDNTRRWARDKAELQLKLSETQMSQQPGQWQYPNRSQEPFSLFDRTPSDSVNLHDHSRLSSPKLSPLTKK